jgi:uncharacterized protein (DUF1499 family)
MSKLRDGWVKTVWVLALLLPVWFLVAALGTKFGILDWRIGFGLMVFRLGGLLLLGVLVLAVIGLLMALLVKPRRGWGRALVAVVIPALALGFAASVMSKAKDIPPIHDITTDIADPPAFSQAVIDARAAIGGGNPITPLNAPVPALKGKTVGELGKAANPDLAPLALSQSVPDATKLVAEVAAAEGLKLTRTGDGVVEAVAETFWFGFKDDVVFRIRPAPSGAGSVVDIRSASRVGMSDLGANGKRIGALSAAIKAKAG